MVDVLELNAGESAWVDTTANIVSIINLAQSLEVYDSNNELIITMQWGEVYTLGYNKGSYRIRNGGDSHGRAYIVRQFIL